MSSSSKLYKSAALYTLSHVAAGALPFLALPFLTRHLTTTDFGHIGMFMAAVTVATPLLGLGIHGAVSRYYFERAEMDFRSFVGTAFSITCGLTLLLAFIAVVFSEQLSSLIELPSSWISVILLTSFFQTIVNVGLVLFRVRFLSVHYSIALIAQTILTVGGALVLVLGFGWDWQGRAISQTFATVCVGVLALTWLVRNKLIRPSFDKAYSIEYLKFGLPLTIHTFGGLAITQSDRFFLANMTTLGATGVYVLATQITAALTTTADAYNRAYSPWLMSELKRAETDKENSEAIKDHIVKMVYRQFGVAFLAWLAFNLVAAPLVRLYVGPEFQGATKYLPWLSTSALLYMLYTMTTTIVTYAKKNQYLAFITLTCGSIGCAISYYFIKAEGPMGAAKGAVAAYFLLFFVTWFAATRAISLPWFKRRIA